MNTKAKKGKKKKIVSNFSPVNHKAIMLMRRMLECIPPARLKKNLLSVFLIFLEREHQHLPVNFDTMLSDHYLLFQFLDDIDEEMKITEERMKNSKER